MTTTLPCSIDAAWEALHTPGVFRRVSTPFTVFRTPPSSPLPPRFHPGTDYEVRVFAGGLIPLGRQTIHLVDTYTNWATRSTVDQGHGDSGALALLRNWRHQMSVRARADGHTDFHDQLTVDAGWLTPLAWMGMQLFWWWRVWRLRSIASTLDAPVTTAWNERYAGKDAMWSGKVNPVVAQHAPSFPVGRALDVGCGEGADALFLAEHGHDTLGVEASSVALYRAHQEAETRRDSQPEPLLVNWLVADIAAPWSWRKGHYDLVSLQFVHTDQATRQRIWAEAIQSVAPGGTLLVVGHDPEDAKRGIPRPPAEMCFSEEEFRQAIPDSWSSLSTSTTRRTQTIHGRDVEVADIVGIATR